MQSVLEYPVLLYPEEFSLLLIPKQATIDINLFLLVHSRCALRLLLLYGLIILVLGLLIIERSGNCLFFERV